MDDDDQKMQTSPRCHPISKVLFSERSQVIFAPSHVPVIRKAFQMFDTNKSGFIETLKISTILNTMGQLFDDNELQALIDETDPEGTVAIQTVGHTSPVVFGEGGKVHVTDIRNGLSSIRPALSVTGTGKVNFDGFTRIAAHFLEEEDAEAMQQELKEAFRLYDREGNGYITTATLREILAALDDKLGPDDLDGIITEIDTDGSGTVDFDGPRVHGDDDWRVKKPLGSNYAVLCFHLVANPGTWFKSNTYTSLRENIRLFNIITHIHRYTIEKQGTPSSLTGTK
uniref:EF-hand domain-containing protein n=1 Tax=Timema tahoe TaxID=61484 RepID=A0A7R9NXE8_9NEOP|nr:unnamed protein product [Timema tahoe]